MKKLNNENKIAFLEHYLKYIYNNTTFPYSLNFNDNYKFAGKWLEEMKNQNKSKK